MVRRLPIGSYGIISATRLGARRWRARARFRGADGRVRIVQATGVSRAGAVEDLRRRLAEQDFAVASGMLTKNSSVSKVVGMWQDSLPERGLSPMTVDRYLYIARKFIVPRLGDLRVCDVTPGSLNAFVLGVRDDAGPTNGKHARVILKQVFAIAVSYDALDRNPVDSVPALKVERAKVTKALTIEQVQQMRELLRGDARDAFDVILGTGCRISEVIGLRWEDVHLDEKYLEVVGAVKLDKHKPYWDEKPKSGGSAQKIFLPSFTVDALSKRAPVSEYVFVSAAGTLYNPHNFRKAWRKQLAGTEFEGVHPHMIRATVATLVAQNDSVAHASALLGHSSEDITIKHYIERQKEAPNLVELLESFGQH